jgi:hypothetical protein
VPIYRRLNLIIFNSFYLRFCFGPSIFAEHSILSVYGVSWLGIEKKYHHTHTHTSYFLNTSLKKTLSSHLTRSKKNAFIIRANLWDRTPGRLTTGCWAVRLQVWRPWLVLNTSLVLVWHGWIPAFSLLLSETRSPVCGQEPGFLTLTEERSFSPSDHYTVGTSGNAVQSHYFSCFMARLFTDQSVYFCTGQIISPSGMSDLCGTVDGMVRPKGRMSTEGKTP